jgi:7-carboxy-7-deazaguanine synthase
MPSITEPARPRDDIPVSERLRLTEIFHSLQGEADTVGLPTVFVRLTGCPLRCHYCDTAYAFHGGAWHSIEETIAQVGTFGIPAVCVTGGEPLAQPNVHTLLTRLCDAGYRVSIETSGALDARGIDARVVRVIDVKTPGSGESSRHLLDNYHGLRASDVLKFVITSRADYEWSKAQVSEHQLQAHAQVMFSPSFTDVAPKVLAEWMLEDRLSVRFQLQLHKVLWGEVAGR